MLFAPLLGTMPVPPEVICPVLSTPPIVDGRLDEAVWQDAAVLDGFSVFKPIEGRHPSQRTRAYVFRDRTHLYVGVRAYDSNPDKIQAGVTRRDGIFSDDWVMVALDPFRDFTRGYLFYANAHGVQADGISSPTQFHDDYKWDAVFETAGEILDDGYSVEIAIPFASIRFSPRQDAWGVQIQRWIPRTGEVLVWAPMTADRTSTLEQSGVLHGMSGLPPPRTLELIPEITGRAGPQTDTTGGLIRSPGGGGDVIGEPATLDLGVSGRFNMGGRGAIDLAFNPDFSQVETDAAKITVNQRFALSFEEKRPLFQEGQALFSMPWQVVYTRSIVDPLYGAKVIGKWGSTAVGVIHAMDESPADSAVDARWNSDAYGGEPAFTTLVRSSTSVTDRATLGVFAGEKRIGRAWNRLGGFDVDTRVTDQWRVVSQVLASATDHPNGDAGSGWGAKLRLIRSGRHWYWFSWYEELSPEFRAEMGFIPRVGYRETGATTSYRIETGNRFLIAVKPRLDPKILNSTINSDRERTVQGAVELELPTGTVAFRYLTGQERFAGQLFPRDRGTIDVGYRVNKRISFSVNGSAGKQIRFDRDDPFAGYGISTSASIGYLPTDSISLGLSYGRSILQRHFDRDTEFDATVVRARAEWFATRSLGFRVIADYTDDDDRVVLEGLVSYQPAPATAVYIGYRGPVDDGPDALFLKLSYLFRTAP